MQISVGQQVLELHTPLRTAFGTIAAREVMTVWLTDDAGLTSYGDVAPLEPYDGVSADRVMAAFERYRPLLEGLDGLDPVEVLATCERADALPAALSAIDLALWDKAGRRQGQPVAALLSDDARTTVQVNATLTATDRLGAAEQAMRAVEEGFGCLKVKVGLGDDAGRVAAIRAAVGPGAELRLDANGAWSVDEAVRAIETLAPAGLELVEEPTHGIEAMRAVRERVAVRVAIDETAAEPGALDAGAADAVCLKISRCGGITGLLRSAAIARRSGAEVYLASALDGPLAVAAAIHAAAAMSSGEPLPPCGLATVGMFTGLQDLLAPVDGAIPVPEGPGLGIEPG